MKAVADKGTKTTMVNSCVDFSRGLQTALYLPLFSAANRFEGEQSDCGAVAYEHQNKD